MGLVGALAFPGAEPNAFTEPGFAKAPLFVNGQAVPFPLERAAEALQGEWRWIVTSTRIVGAKLLDTQDLCISVPISTKFSDQGVGI